MPDKDMRQNNQQNKDNNRKEKRGNLEYAERRGYDILREHDNSSLHSLLSQLKDSNNKKKNE